MPIQTYLKEIGRGAQGARNLSREAAADLMGQLLDGAVPPVAVGATLMALRMKGETATELAGFLDALHPRLQRVPTQGVPTVVLPSTNGARRLPLLTPLLAFLLAREGLAVLLHGHSTEPSRVFIEKVLQALSEKAHTAMNHIAPGQVCWQPTQHLCPALTTLMDQRLSMGVRNCTHSLIKLMNPCHGPALLVGCYTHPEFATLMAQTWTLTGQSGLLLRGTEGEPVADPRRHPAMRWVHQGQVHSLQNAQTGSLSTLPNLPPTDAQATATWTQQVLLGENPIPEPVLRQVAHIVQCMKQGCP